MGVLIGCTCRVAYACPERSRGLASGLIHQLFNDLFEQAKSYVRQRRNLDPASSLLEQYLSSPLTPDDPPRSKAKQLLNKADRG